MPVFQVRQSATGAILWTGSAAGKIQALDAMAHEAGYYDHSDIPDAVSIGGLAVEALSFGAVTGAAASGERVVGGRSGKSLGQLVVGALRGERRARRLGRGPEAYQLR